MRHKEPGRQVTVRRFGWSDLSMDDAQRQADERARQALERILSGESMLARREPKVAYNGAEGVPIREEILSRHGDAVVTRNLYGALCLNTPNVLFVDIDRYQPVPLPLSLTIFVLLTAVSISLGVMEGSVRLTLGLFLFALFFSYPLAAGLYRLHETYLGGPHARTARRIRRFAAKHPDWHLRLYDTPAGQRVLVMHDVFEPNDPRVTMCFRALQADRVYVRMCQRQHCFRARVSPKPWNMGINVHIKPRPGVWPIDPKHLPARQNWLREYETMAASFAACRFVEQIGSTVTHETAEAVRKLHDDLSRAHSGLTMA